MRIRGQLTRIIPPKKPPPPNYPDPNSPSSPGYAERNRKKVTELPSGTLRIDIGCEGD